MKKYKLPIIITILSFLTITIISIITLSFLENYSFSKKYADSTYYNVRIYRHKGKSYLEETILEESDKKFNITAQEKKIDGGMNIIDDKGFAIIQLKNTRYISKKCTELSNGKKCEYDERPSNILYKGKTDLIKHIQAVMQIQKKGSECLESYYSEN